MSAQIKQVDGIVCDETNMRKSKVFIRYTKDQKGETLSLESSGNMIAVDAGELRKILGVKK